MRQMLSEANLESIKSIRPVKVTCFQAHSLAGALPELLQLGGAHLLSPRAHQVAGKLETSVSAKLQIQLPC